MTPPPNREVALFSAALELPASQRSAYLAEACADDPALRLRVEALLRVHEDAITFLENKAPGAKESPMGAASPDATVRLPTSPSEKAGDRIGRYKLLQQIGEGGCGVVYMAEQEEPVRRRVALKVIKLGMDTRQVIARFEAERQALALMDHPNIAKVLDAGATETGRPYFVMELVRGIKITDFCDENSLSTEQRLNLFIEVCHAIQHAHQKGIIHRDIKPSNILVADHDGVPVPKIIDFGIAKATTDQRLTDKTLFTAFEQFIGTPAYMSPEQAKLSGLDVDTRSDIYSLGVLLYELLTGATPFDSKALMQAGLDEIRRTIRESEPPRPSTRLGTMLEGELTLTAKQRHTDAPKLVHLLRGDLDWIVMKALEKDRARRYETANGLLSDIQRHLDNEPIVARPASRFYRFQKLARRNKLTFAAVGAVAAALVIGLGLATWQFIEKSRAYRLTLAEKQKAQTEAAKSQQVARFLQDMLKGVGPAVARGRDTVMLREILDTTAERVGRELKDQPAVEAELRGTVGEVYWELGEYGKSEAMHRQALALSRQIHGNKDLRVASSLNWLAVALWWQGKLEAAETAERESLSIRKELLGNADHQDTAGSLDILALILFRQGKNLVEAEASERQALAMRRKVFGGEDPWVATSLDNLALVLWRQGKLDEAEITQRQGLAMKKKLLGNEHVDVGYSLSNLGMILNDQDKVSEAEAVTREVLALRRKVLGNQHPEVALTLARLSGILKRTGRLTEAEALDREWLQNLRARVPPEDPELAMALAEVTSTLLAAEKFVEAEPLARECLVIREKKLPDDLLTFNARSLLGRCLLGQRKYPDAEPLLLSGYEGMRQCEVKIPPEGKPGLKEALQCLMQLYEATGRHDQAAHWRQRLELFDREETQKKAAAAPKELSK